MTETALTAPTADHDHLSFQQGIRTALAAVLAYWITSMLRLPGGYWAAISAIVVMQSEVGATVTASRDRLAGTAMGAVVGLLTSLVWHHSLLVFGLAVLVVMMLSTALNFKNAGRLGGVTVAIIVLIPYPGPLWHIALQRFLEVSFGIVISLGVAVAWTQVSKRLSREPA
ncbi:MAG: FUSC family protein [Acidobacteriaceae bacterium]